MFQDFVRFELPLRDNVAPGGAPDAAIRRALEQAGAGPRLADLLAAMAGPLDLHAYESKELAHLRLSRLVAPWVASLFWKAVRLDLFLQERKVRRAFATAHDLTVALWSQHVHAQGKTVVLGTHDLGGGRYFADRVVLLHEGRVVQEGPFEDLIERPAGEFVTRFVQAQRWSA